MDASFRVVRGMLPVHSLVRLAASISLLDMDQRRSPAQKLRDAASQLEGDPMFHTLGSVMLAATSFVAAGAAALDTSAHANTGIAGVTPPPATN